MVENPGLWNWTFTLKDINGEVLAQIDRDWRGFGFEVGFWHLSIALLIFFRLPLLNMLIIDCYFYLLSLLVF